MTDAKELKELLIEGTLLRIPEYQRGYQWDDENVFDMYRDLRRAAESEDNRHYFGTVVTVQKNSSEVNPVKDIVDGQQRITTVMLFMKGISKKIDEVYDEEKTQNLSEEKDRKFASNIRERNRTRIESTVYDSDKDKLFFEPAMKHKPSFAKIIKEGEVEKPEINDTMSQQNMRESYNKIMEYIEMYISGDDGYLDMLNSLDTLMEALLERFKIMEYEIDKENTNDAMKEAALYFECINDRGKELYEIDRVKSHILYRHSLIDDEDVASRLSQQEIHERFVSVEEEIQQTRGDYGSNIEEFILHFFYMFTGRQSLESKTKISGRQKELKDVSDRIKHGIPHVPIQKSDKRVMGWIETFTEAMVDIAEAYKKINTPLEYYDNNRLNELLYVIDNFFPARSLSIRLSLQYAYDDRRGDYQDIIEELETFTIRVFEIMMAKSNTKTSRFIKLSQQLFWTANEKNADDVMVWDMNSNTRSESVDAFDDLEVATDELVDEIRSYTVEKSFVTDEDGKKVDQVKDRVMNQNIIDGSGEGNFGGIRNSEQTARYILLMYEKNYDEYNNTVKNPIAEPVAGHFFELENPSEFDTEKTKQFDGLSYEHVWPNEYSERPDFYNESEEVYNNLVGMIGNGYLLTVSDNSVVGTKDYADKRSVYKKKGAPKMLDGMPDAYDGWSQAVIEDRSEEIAKFVADFWSVES